MGPSHILKARKILIVMVILYCTSYACFLKLPFCCCTLPGYDSFIIPDVGDKKSRAKPLSVEEERVLRVFYEYKIQVVCGAFKFPHKIQVHSCV